jgi:Crp-like helix-turn-helix domain
VSLSLVEFLRRAVRQKRSAAGDTRQASSDPRPAEHLSRRRGQRRRAGDLRWLGGALRAIAQWQASDPFGFSIQAVTDVRYCYFPFAEVRARIRNNPALFEAWLRLTASEQRDADKRLVDLGQRTAQERIAALLVHVMHRCEERGEVSGEEFPFPLSQQQIADFTGLTPVHTCRVLSSLRKDAVCDVGHGVVKVMERRELQRMGALK